MPKNLLIVESPAKAKTIEKYLGSDFTVRASYGHVRDLVKGDKAIDVENNFEPTYAVIDDKKKVISELKKLIKDHDQVWLATDEDREGEAISWHLANALGLDMANTPRIVFNEITKAAIQKAIQNPRFVDANLVNAQQARRVLDRLVGFKLSPLLWKKIRAGLSAGRVQSVAVRLIVEREREVMHFKPTASFRVSAEFMVGGKAKVAAKLSTRFDTNEDARAFLESCKGADYTITNLQTRPGKKSPTAPFTTSTLQQEASRKLSFPVGITMRVAQKLYEAGKITYMRTDSVNLSDTALGQAEDAIKSLYGTDYHKLRKFSNKNKDAQEAHEAIRPTDFSVSEVKGSRDEQRLYDLIWKRSIASQMADAQLEKTTVDIETSTNKSVFKATGEVLKFDGFLKVYMEGQDDEDDEKEDAGVLPPMTVGEKLGLVEMQALQRFTRPSPRFTEASLVKKLEELGIGRPSTYAPTISTVQSRNYVVKETRDGVKRDSELLILSPEGNIKDSVKTENVGAENKKLFPTDLGMVVTDFLVKFFPDILNYSFTRQVEDEFDHIANGSKGWRDMIGDFYKDFAIKVADTIETADREGGDRDLGIDPKSGRKIIARLGRYGPMVQLGHSDDEEKPKYAKLRPSQRLETVTLEEALELFKMPRILGEYEDQQVKANIGRFGPYVQLGSLFASLEEGDDVHSVDLVRGIELIELKRKKDREKMIKIFDDEVSIQKGRWGPYIKYGKANVKIPKEIEDPTTLTREDVDRLHEEHLKNPKKGRGKKKK
ncbi:MAG: type I DNA topoisomerase [Bacteroidia bacterium]